MCLNPTAPCLGCPAAELLNALPTPLPLPSLLWERSSASTGEGETKIAVQINSLHSQLQNCSKCRIHSSNKAFFPPPLMVATAFERLGGLVPEKGWPIL